MASDTYGQFSVILRPRVGTPCPLSTYEIVTQIKARLSKYKGIFNIAVSPPNFVVHLNTLELQLHVLALKEFSGPDYILDVKPWTSEYASLQLPWILNSMTEGSSSMPAQIQVNIPDGLQRQTPIADFSFLMILELKDFYYSKLEAFLKCEETCKMIYDLARPFSDDVEPRIDTIYKQAERYSSIPRPEILSAVPDFGNSLNYQQLFIGEEIFGLYMTMDSIYRTRQNPLCLAMFQNQESNQQVMCPAQSKDQLKAIFEAVVATLYPATNPVIVHMEYDDCIYTNISSESFSYRYKLPKPATKVQAEAVSYYRFLKHLTNVVGYNVVDKNWYMLEQTVSAIEKYTHLISDLQYCVNTVTNMMSSVEKNVKNMYKEMLDEVPSEKIPQICGNVDSLISLIEDYSAAVARLSNTFNERKSSFRCIKLSTPYSPRSDGP